jgi:hypothetical protein
MIEWNFETGEQMTPEESAGPHNFMPYLRSITNELTAVKDRVRLLVPHWLTDGHFKEAILRQLLRRHVPESMLIGTGFVLNSFGPSTEVDVLVVDRSMPTLFKEDELLIVTPESVKAVIEVKTRLNGQSELSEAAIKLAAQKAHVQRHVKCKDVWAGLFVYEGLGNRHEDILNALGVARAAHQCCIDSVAYGADTFVKFFSIPEDQGGPAPSNAWHSFDDLELAPADFVASLIEALVPLGKDMGSFAWFSRRTGFTKRFYLEAKAASSPTAFALKT